MSNSRRDFLRKGALLSLSGIVGSTLANDQMEKLEELGTFADGGKYSLPALPYGYDALEPFIDKETMTIHHDKHHQAYVDNLNKALEEYKGKDLKSPQSFENIFKVVSKLPAPLRNNAGGHYNHSMFWTMMKPNKDNASNLPLGKVADAINGAFGSFEEFQKQFGDAAMKRFGSGWAWLYEENKKLKIGSTPNQDNPLMDLSEIKGKPLLALDVWEHAYYLKYQNKRADYIANWWKVVNWDTVAKML
jgi:Fe-Mn family superoxide dismutase